MIRRRTLLAGALAAPSIAHAAWPERAVTLLHGFAAGGAADTVARILAPPMAEALGRPVVVEARPGAGGNIANLALSRATPDGQTLGLMTGSHATAAAFGRITGYDPVDGFAWITIALRYAFALVVRPDHPARTLADLLAIARQAPGALAYGSLGPGSSHFMAGESFAAAAGVTLTSIPYRSDMPGLTAVLGGELPVMMSTTVGAMPLLRDGQLRALAVTSATRSPRLPDVPAVAETLPGFEASTWAGFAAPRGTPPAILERVHALVVEILARPAFKHRLEELVDGVAAPTPLAETRDIVAAEIARWRALIMARGLRVDEG